MPVQSPRRATRVGRGLPTSGGQNRLGRGFSTMLAVLTLATLLGACRSTSAPAPTATPAVDLTGVVSAPRATATASFTQTPSASPSAVATSTRTAAPSRTATRTAIPSRTLTSTPTATTSPTPTRTATTEPTRALVVAEVFEVIDGDTIGVRIEGQTYRVRYIGIDTPEIVHPGLPVEPYGPEAADANRRMVLGQRVMLERDVSDTDTYGCLLRYVWLGDTLINAELVRLGLAQSNHYEPDVFYQERLDALEAQAQAAGLGIWGITRASPVAPTAGALATPLPVRVRAGSVYIAAVNKAGKPETVVLTNGWPAAVDLSGWTLVSVRGNQRYAIPGGTMLETGASLTIYSGAGADAAGPLYWTTSNMWNNSELDPAELYDASGGLVDRWEG